MKKVSFIALAVSSLLAVTACAGNGENVTNNSKVITKNTSTQTTKAKKPFTNADYSQQAYDATVSKKQVSYHCQNKKSVKVTYGFDKKGKPTYAMALLEGKQRFMPLNFQRSDNVDTNFGDDNSHRIGTSYMDSNKYKTPILITNQANQIIFKNCFADK